MSKVKLVKNHSNSENISHINTYIKTKYATRSYTCWNIEFVLHITKRDEEEKRHRTCLVATSMCSHDFILGCLNKNRLAALTCVPFISNFSNHLLREKRRFKE
ncbi:uncharacterized protein LOC143154269 [Ptiloglossa arizonensis]|uniref:uncharacterized protein LOC143154269 n=1 Tax=Ptiloglossa arizonensis TaxID=3350558 RepID=UPI003F9F9A5D